MEHFRRYFDAPRAPQGGAVTLADGRALSWTADHFRRTRASGESADVTPDDLGVHLSRWRTIAPRLVGESVDHYLNVVVRGAGKPFELRAKMIVDCQIYFIAAVISSFHWVTVRVALKRITSLLSFPTTKTCSRQLCHTSCL